MPDIAHVQTDEMIAALAKRIRKEYAAASARVEKQLKDALKKYERERRHRSDELVKAMQGVPFAERRRMMADFMAWRDQELTKYKLRDGLLDKLNYEMLDADRLAREMVAKKTGEAFTANGDYATYQIEKGLGQTCATWTLYDQDTVSQLLTEHPDLYPKPDLDTQKAWKWNAEHLESVIAQAVVSGDAVEDIAKSLRGVMGMNQRDALRVARTSMTAAENSGRVQSYKRAQAMGIELKQTWLATLDERTRASHRELDGEQAEVGGTFSNGLRFPGDPRGAAAEVMNCRCTLVASVDGEAAVDGADGRWSRLPEGMTYDEWKEMKRHGQGD